MLTQI
jgi:hypothetical protein